MPTRHVAAALTAAWLFGVSTPWAKWLGVAMSPTWLAGLLYLGSGIGLSLTLVVRALVLRAHRRPVPSLRLPRQDVPWLAGAIVSGGILGPVCLVTGLLTLDGATASMLLNLEGVFTALLAWIVFKENTDRGIVFGMLAIVAGGVLLSLHPAANAGATGVLLVIAACLCWALDNNLTRKVSSHDAMLIAAIKGGVAGATNTTIALLGHAPSPAWPQMAQALVVGFAGYGLSLTLFIVALRGLGSARTGAYFSAAPLFGVAMSLLIWPAWPAWSFWAAAGLMALGMWLHWREQHDHEHDHEALEHTHPHRHDAHHQHAHTFPWDGTGTHVHPHVHAAMTHRHPHYPDLHHRHRHP